MDGLNSIVVFLVVSPVTSSVVNTTQFENFTVEWEDFNLFTCGVPTVINISLFTCASSIGYKQIDDIECLESTTINFNESVCPVALTATTASSTTTQITTTGTQVSHFIDDEPNKTLFN